MWSVAPRKGFSLSRSEWQQGCLVVKVLLKDCSFKVVDLFDWKGKRLEINSSPNFNSTRSCPSAPNSSPFLELNTLLSWNSGQTSFKCSALIEEHLFYIYIYYNKSFCGKNTKPTERRKNPSAINNKPTVRCHGYHLYSTFLLSCHQLILSFGCNCALFLFLNTVIMKRCCSACCRSPTWKRQFSTVTGSFSSASPPSRSLPMATATLVLMGGFMILIDHLFVGFSQRISGQNSRLSVINQHPKTSTH